MASAPPPAAAMPMPFAPGSISLGLHPASQLPSTEQVAGLLEHARRAETAGFDGVTVSEHHAGFESYLPQPLSVTGWVLDVTERLWAAPLPLLLGLRRPTLVAEELAWCAARFPGRVALGVAPGYAASDFAAVGVEFAGRIDRFRAAQAELVDILEGRGPLGADAAIAGWSARPGPLLSATNSVSGVELAAALGLGIVFPGSEDPERLHGLTARYRQVGGDGPVVWIRNFWIGERPSTAAADRLAASYQQAAAADMRQAHGFADHLATGEAEALAEHAVRTMRRIGATAINVRLHVAGLPPSATAEQIDRFGDAVLPVIRAAFG